MNRNAGFRQLGMEQCPEVREVRTQEQLLLSGEQEVCEDLEVGHEFVGPMQTDVNVLFAAGKERQEELEDLGHGLQTIVGLYTVS